MAATPTTEWDRLLASPGLFFVDVKDRMYGDGAITDADIATMPPDTIHLLFGCSVHQNVGAYKPIRIALTGAGLSGLRTLEFRFIIGGLDTDAMFANCTSLEEIWFGASSGPFLTSIENLKTLPLKLVTLQGWGTVSNYLCELEDAIPGLRRSVLC